MSYIVRDAHGYEIDKIVEKSRVVLMEMPTYRGMTFDHEKTANYICGAILKQPGWFIRVIAERETDEPVGAIVGVCETSFFGPDKVAYDVTFMIEEAHRGRCVAQLVKMIHDFREWATANGAKVVKIGVSSGLNIGKAADFLNRIGFTQVGSMHAYISGV